MMDSFEQEAYDEELVNLENGVKAALKALGRNKEPGFDGISIELFQATENKTKNPNKNM